MNKISMKILKESAKVYDIELPKGDIQAAADALLDHFNEIFEETNMVECQDCKMEGPEYDEEGNMITTCPYCGVLFSDDEAEEVPEKSSTDDDDDDDDDDDGDNEETPKKKKKSKGKKKSAKDKATPAKKRGRPKKEPVEIVPLSEEEEKEFRESMSRVQEFRMGVARNSWRLGRELIFLQSKEGGWRAKGHDTFEEFCQKELDISRSGAHKYRRAAEQFDEELYNKLGIKKADLIASAPEEHKDTLIDNVEKNNASYPELKKQLDKLTGKVNNAGEKGLTLNSRVREGDIDIPWLSEKNHKPIKRKTTTNRYARIEVTQEVEMVIMEADNGLGLTVCFQKIKTTGKK